MRVGFIGLGAMGRPMAQHLLRGGHALAVWSRRPESAQPLVDAGATRCPTPAALAQWAEVVFSIVTTGADVEQVVFGPQGLAEGFAPGAVFVDMSTIAPATARGIATRLAARGVDMLDAPVSGGEAGAIAGTLAIMAGGEAAVLERVRPLLACFGPRIVHVGGLGAGQVAKACNQMVMVGCIEAVAEALHLARAAGADPARVREALAGGSAGSRVLEVFGGRMVERDFRAGVEARLHHKDYGNLMQDACRSGVPLPVSAQVWQQLNALMALGGGRQDSAALLRVLEAASGASSRES
jgi:2-hydroxy-3-oxopropionate reductase